MPTIDQPELPPLIVNGSGAHKYVFTYKNTWDPKLKRAVRGKGDTKCVGRFEPIVGEAGYGEIIFNDEFKEQHPAIEHLRVFRRKGGKLEFKPILVELTVAKPFDAIQFLHGGATWALNQIVGGTPLAIALHDVFATYKRDLKFLSLAYYLVINKDSSLCNYEEFAECTWLPYQAPMISSTISRFLGGISIAEIFKFQKRLNEEFVKKYGDKIVETRFLALDSTSITSYSKNIASVEYGHNKDLIEAPQTNVLLIVDQETGAPLLWRNFDGNVPDVSTVLNTIAQLSLLDVKKENLVLVMDRGYGSQANYDDLLRNGIGFVNNVRLGSNSFLKPLIEKHYAELLDWNNENNYLNQTTVTVPIEWRYDEFPVANKRSKKSAKKTVYVHMYFNKALQEQAEETLRRTLTSFLSAYRKKPDSVKDVSEQIISTYMKEDKGVMKIDMQKVDQRLRYVGIRVLMSDAIKDALECHVAYDNRNEVEYGFNTMKSRLSCNRTKAHSTEHWESKLFLQVLASSIGIMVHNRIKAYNDRAKAKKLSVHYDSDHKLLAKLNNIYLTKVPGGWVFNEIAGKKKELFKVLNVPVPTAERQVASGAVTDEEAPETAPNSADTLIPPGTDEIEDL